MRSLLIDVENAEVKEIEVNSIDDFYKYINCSTIDIVGRYIGDEKRLYSIVIDDNGALKENAIPSAINLVDIMLYGNLVITKKGDIDEELQLTEHDIDYLYRYIRTGYKIVENNVKEYPILVHVNYFKD